MGAVTSSMATQTESFNWFLPTAGLFLAFILFVFSSSSGKQPPSLRELIPLYNTYQYLTDVGTFMDRVTSTLDKNKSNIVKFNIGFRDAYIVRGTKHVQKVFGPPTTVDSNFLQLILMDKHWGMTKEETAKFANDKSGRLQNPLPGHEHTPHHHRFWLGHGHLYAEFLSKRQYTDALAASFYEIFSSNVDEQNPVGEWTTVSLFEMLKRNMAEAAVISVFGSKLIELNPGFIEAYWDFDHIAGTLVWGLPKWTRPGPFRKHERLHEMTQKHMDAAWADFDWNGPDADSDWEPHFGSRLSRETAKWLREGGFSNRAAAGHTLASLFGLNGNTVPVTCWALIELIKDPKLFASVSKEALLSLETDSETGQRGFNAQKLVSGPLLQSIYVEIMRLHVSFNVTREVLHDLEFDEVVVKKGSLLQCSSQMAHYEDSVWGVDDHPASEFYAQRHIKYTMAEDESGKPYEKAQFSMKGRPSSFFPYGGGYVMCPGRHFAKQEIILAIATIVTKFDIELLEWTHLDGTKSDRPAMDDKTYAGFIAMSPDRDMKIRWKRLY
ncbi:hypothetical protein NHJ13734_009550 [Beauveria thailandica]